jgi:phosphohistidine phosphatase
MDVPMKRLLLLRHAKSSWDDPALPDHDRPLAPRGRRAAERMGEHLRSNLPTPDLVLSSSAARTRQTLERTRAFGDAEVRVEKELYAAGADTILERIQALAETFETVAVIGHNPGIQDLALVLSGAGEDRDRMADTFPTGALAVLEFDGPWRELGPGAARLVSFVAPRDLR